MKYLSSDWHVWHVDSYFYAANSLEEAKEYHREEWGIDEDEDFNWEDKHYDNGDFHRSDTTWGESWDRDGDCTLRERAEEMILEDGETLPFMVAVELN